MEFINKPRVFFLAETRLRNEEVNEWLKYLGGEKCLEHVTGDDIEKVTEFAARRCYNSYVPGLNPNVTKVRTDSGEYIRNIINSKHGSTFEHSMVTFAFEGVSRVFTHEAVRHRAGVAISQESLRYVRLINLKAFFPKGFGAFGKAKEEKARMLMTRLFNTAEDVQKEFAEIFKEEIESDKFGLKKILTSGFRRCAPIGLATGIIMSFNMRALRHVIENRTSRHAEEEIRMVFGEVADIMMKKCPYMFDDFQKIDTKDGLFEYVPAVSKV